MGIYFPTRPLYGRVASGAARRREASQGASALLVSMLISMLTSMQISMLTSMLISLLASMLARMLASLLASLLVGKQAELACSGERPRYA